MNTCSEREAAFSFIFLLIIRTDRLTRRDHDDENDVVVCDVGGDGDRGENFRLRGKENVSGTFVLSPPSLSCVFIS